MAKRKLNLKRLTELFEHMPQEWQDLNRGLLENAIFMESMLAALRQDIALNGLTSEWRNGPDQGGQRKSPAVDIYNTTIKNYQAVIKQLNDALPDFKDTRASEIMDFLSGSD